jgi:hypothetical protein
VKRSVLGFDQAKAVAAGLTIADLQFLDWLMYWQGHGTMAEHEHDGKRYYWVCRDKVLRDLPILGFTSTKSITRMMSRLSERGFLESLQVATTRGKGSRAYVRVTHKCRSLLYDQGTEMARGQVDQGTNLSSGNAGPGDKNVPSDKPPISNTTPERDKAQTAGKRRYMQHETLDVPVGATRYRNLCAEWTKTTVDRYIEKVIVWEEATKGKRVTKDYAARAAQFMDGDVQKGLLKKKKFATDLPDFSALPGRQAVGE